MDKRDDTRPDDADRSVGAEVDEQATVLREAFNLSPETAGMAAADLVTDRMRKPASDDVEHTRIAEAAADNDEEETR